MLHRDQQQVKIKVEDQHLDLEVVAEAELAEGEVIPKDLYHTTKFKHRTCETKTLNSPCPQETLLAEEEEDKAVHHQLTIHKA